MGFFDTLKNVGQAAAEAKRNAYEEGCMLSDRALMDRIKNSGANPAKYAGYIQAAKERGLVGQNSR